MKTVHGDKVPWQPCGCSAPWADTAPEFEAFTIFSPRIGDKSKWCVNLRVRCALCKREFKFDEMQRGILHGMTPATPGYMGYGAVLPISPLDNSEARIVEKADPWDGQLRGES